MGRAGRGFVGTFAAAAFVGLLMVMVAFAQQSYRLRERSFLEYSYGESVLRIFDSSASAVQNITGVYYLFARNGTRTNSTFYGGFPLADFSGGISAYSGFLSANFSNATSSYIAPDFSSLSSGDVTILSNGGIEFVSDYSANSAGVQTVSPSGNTRMTDATIELDTPETLGTTVPWTYDPSGDANVTLVLRHAGGTLQSSGKMLSTVGHTYTMRFGGNNRLRAFFGKQATRDGVFGADALDMEAKWKITALIPYVNASSWYYDAQLGVSKGNIRRDSKLFVYGGQ